MNYSTLVLTSHDQVFLDRLSEQTIALRNQGLDYFDGTPTSMQTVEAEERVHKEKMINALDKKKEHVGHFLDPHIYIYDMADERLDRGVHSKRPKTSESNRR
jgi:ATPase subunit of ABC transporter with duplicated ATPase domains